MYRHDVCMQVIATCTDVLKGDTLTRLARYITSLIPRLLGRVFLHVLKFPDSPGIRIATFHACLCTAVSRMGVSQIVHIACPGQDCQ